MSDEYVDATFFVQVEPDWFVTGKRLRGARAVRLTQSRPSRPVGGTVLTKLTIRLPRSAFMPLLPEAVVVVPEGSTLPIQVEANDANDEEAP
jgi:hypothetical protein